MAKLDQRLGFDSRKKIWRSGSHVINKSDGFHLDPHHSISSLGWVEDETGKRGKSSRQEVYNWLKQESGQAYVVDSQGHKASVLPRENAHGTQFLQTVADRVWTDNLLALPECQD